VRVCCQRVSLAKLLTASSITWLTSSSLSFNSGWTMLRQELVRLNIEQSMLSVELILKLVEPRLTL
jgi:hypothetical protein